MKLKVRKPKKNSDGIHESSFVGATNILLTKNNLGMDIYKTTHNCFHCRLLNCSAVQMNK